MMFTSGNSSVKTRACPGKGMSLIEEMVFNASIGRSFKILLTLVDSIAKLTEYHSKINIYPE